MATFQFRVNGSAKTVQTDDPSTPLLYVLRNDLDLTGTHFGCGLAQCGACTVHVDGRAARSCSVTVSAVHGKSVTTIEGLGTPAKPDPLQEAFIAEQAAQCGYCTAGIVMTARALLTQKPRATEREVRDALEGNLCRCGSHDRVLKAVMRVAAARS
jgi:nicotinate dehydrogenase subunit A